MKLSLSLTAHFAVSVSICFSALLAQSTIYATDELNPSNPDRNVQAGVPQGKVTVGVFAEANFFQGHDATIAFTSPNNTNPTHRPA